MTELRDHLDAIGGVRPNPSRDQIAADLSRGRTALRRRRAGQTIGGSVLAVAVAAAMISVSSAGGTQPGPTGDGRPATVTAARLVAYAGTQPKGFTIDKVPDGWFIQSDENISLTLAPDSTKNPGPGVDPSKDPVYDKQSFVGKIGILLESKDQHGPPRPGAEVKVGDRTGTLVKSLRGQRPGDMTPSTEGDTGWELWVRQPSGVYLIVQFWEGLGMSQDQMVELAAGVHVHKAALQMIG